MTGGGSDEPALTLLVGTAGVGRTHALNALRQSIAADGRQVLEVRLAPADRDEPWYLVGRLLAGLAPLPTRLAAGRAHSIAADPSATTLARTLSRHPSLVVLVDDAQWMDVDSAVVLLGALHELAGTPVRCIATVRAGAVPDPAVAEGYERLRAAAQVHISPVRPLTATESDALVRQALQATPHPSLSVPLRRLGRGIPAALLASVEGYRRSGALRIVDRRAYLADPSVTPLIPVDHDLMAPVRRLSPAARAAARALAVLQPLGAAVPALIDRPSLDILLSEGVARTDRRGWRVAVPAMAVALRAELGPYERAHLAQIAVEAVCSGAAHCDDPDFLPEQVAAAGTMVDQAAALSLLRERADAIAVRNPAAAARWWAAAASLSGDPADRAESQACRADADLRAGRPEVRQEDAETGGVGARRRAAAAAIDRFGDAVLAGELSGADQGLAAAGLTVADLPIAERCLLDWLAGRWDAAWDAAQFGLAADLLAGRPRVRAAVHRAAAEVLLGRGRPARARAVLDAARTGDVPRPQLMGAAAAEVERVLGNLADAGRAARDALVEAARQGLDLGTDELWLITTELAMERGDKKSAREGAACAAATASTLGTGTSALRAATARFIVAHDERMAAEAVAMARRLGQPYELARTLERAVRWTGRSPKVLSEAYELLGDLGAVLHRSRVRQAMRDRGLTVPGRSQTLAEAEQLLAILVAEGLSNRELAAATQSSEKSVEGRLSRLFTRTGYRSRVELAAAVLVGDHLT